MNCFVFIGFLTGARLNHLISYNIMHDEISCFVMSN